MIADVVERVHRHGPKALAVGYAALYRVRMTTVRGDVRSRVLRLFVSYAREDQEGVQELLKGVERLGHEAWVDRKLSGGQAWWVEILARIRACDAMLIVVSPALLDSQASVLERRYAQKLGRPLLPVVICPISSSPLPADLAPLQFVDYTSPGPMAAFELAGALASLPVPLPLPDPLPDEPPVPMSYLSDLTDRVHAAALTLDEQFALIAQIRSALERPGEREAALNLLQALYRRRDLYYAAARDIEEVMSRETSDQRLNPEHSRQVPETHVASPSAESVSLPSGHRQLRQEEAASPNRYRPILIGTVAVALVAGLLGVFSVTDVYLWYSDYGDDVLSPLANRARILVGAAGILMLVDAIYCQRAGRTAAAVVFTTHGLSTAYLALYGEIFEEAGLQDGQTGWPLLISGITIGAYCAYTAFTRSLQVGLVTAMSSIAAAYTTSGVAAFTGNDPGQSIAAYTFLVCGILLIYTATRSGGQRGARAG